jgi:hypothetical protein
MFLDQAQERINRDIASAAVGEIVLAQGKIWLTETSLMQGACTAVGSAKRRYGRLSKGLSTGEPFSKAIGNHKMGYGQELPAPGPVSSSRGERKRLVYPSSGRSQYTS